MWFIFKIPVLSPYSKQETDMNRDAIGVGAESKESFNPLYFGLAILM
jgi:hypothetical protein|tara:strand:- start:169 stop:309 length:141 start_codon:yes stop_codon:yes gene_type:complete